MSLPATMITYVDLSGNHTDISPKPLPELVGKPSVVDEFAMTYYRTLDTMRLEFGDIISLKFQKEREEKPKQKAVLSQLLSLRSEEFSDKVKEFFNDIHNFLTAL
jgi:hypothetical protein